MYSGKVLNDPDKPDNALQSVSYDDFVNNIGCNQVVLSHHVFDPFMKYDIIRSKLPRMLIKTLPLWSVLSVVCYLTNYRILAALCIAALAAAYPLARLLLRQNAWNAILGRNSHMSIAAREELYSQLVSNDLLYALRWQSDMR